MMHGIVVIRGTKDGRKERIEAPHRERELAEMSSHQLAWGIDTLTYNTWQDNHGQDKTGQDTSNPSQPPFLKKCHREQKSVNSYTMLSTSVIEPCSGPRKCPKVSEGSDKQVPKASQPILAQCTKAKK
ncbi:hypothetical protein EYC80_002549 [Monilinia laxa]|uniref:Uncharacterized protein n=1 Tax=Monilinia laxa TaxID=61186 RepID=A0A5N6K4E6_MONLA|nr:hypothetical protein EYC80_002549 [Monilinia laxa]